MSEATTDPLAAFTKLRRRVQTYISVVSLSVLIVCGGCRNPWMENILINLYHIGDKGPGGGIVFYRSAKGFTDTYSGKTHHYLEAVTVDLENEAAPPPYPYLAWASNISGEINYTIINIPGTLEGIGTGRKNTAIILATDANAPAALACRKYKGGGKSDWFLPSKDELNELCNQRSFFGIIGNDYWASSQYNDNNAWRQNFSDSSQSDLPKINALSVRAIRSF